LKHGLTEIHWTTTERNIGSQRTAKKLGFEHIRDYVSYYLCFDEVHHLSLMAYSHLEAARYEQAIVWFEKAFALGSDLPSYAYYDAARAWAGLGNTKNAFKHLHLSIDKGWTYLASMESCSEFAALYDMSEWTNILTRIKNSDSIK
jgi:tetratricopeptide (TPR) repeat protein